MGRTSNSREQYLLGAARLFRRHGYNGTALKDIAAESGAPWGSLYHHFPAGKSELGAEAIRNSGAGYQRLITHVLGQATDPAAGILRFFGLAAEALEASDYADGCPVATTALDTASSNDAVRDACAAVFADWLTMITAELTPTYGDRAPRLATAGLCLLEGAFILCRTLRSVQPMHEAGAACALLLELDT
jgi:AcrR family transcriptional regulator